MNWSKIKEIAGIIVATSAVILSVGGWLLKIWIDDAVEKALAELSFPSDTTIAEIRGRNDVQDAKIESNTKRQDFTDQQLLDLADILRRRMDGD